MKFQKYNQIFDSRLRIKVTALRSFPICLYREAIRLQCFPPTRYVRGAVTRTYERDDHYPICSMHTSRVTSYTVLLSGQFFFFLLPVSATRLEKKNKKKTCFAWNSSFSQILSHIIRGEPERAPNSGETWQIHCTYVCMYVAIRRPRVHHIPHMCNAKAHYISITVTGSYSK